MSTLFTPEEDQFIKDNYLELSSLKIAKELGRSKYGVLYRMKKLNLIVPEEVKKARISHGLTHGHGWNKGMKQEQFLSPETIKKSLKTRYQKGSVPHNTKSDGDLSIRSDGYVYIRTSVGKWELFHRYLYRNYHQLEITTEDNIIFKDGNRRNFDISNLQIATDAEIMINNSIHNYPDELKSAIYALSSLNKKIRTYEKQN